MRRSATSVSAAFAVVAFFVAADANAASGPSTQECLAAAERGQQSRNAGKLMSARADLLVCQAASCPAIVRSDCVRWFGEIADAMPTVVVTVKDAAGADVFDAKVTVDGKPLSNDMLGRALPLDPGAHVVRAARGDVARESQVLVTQGAKQRVVEVVLEAPKDASSANEPVAPPPPAPILPPPKLVPVTPLPPAPLFGTQRYVSVGLAGAGVLSLVVSAAVGAGYNASVADLREGCGKTTSCAQSDVDGIAGQKTTAYVFAGLGASLLVASAIVFVTGAPPRERTHASLFVPGLAPVAGGGLASWGGSF